MQRVLRIGAIAVVLAVTTFVAFELDRFFIPKELALHATAVVAGLLAVRRVRFTRVDWLLAAYLLVSAVSAAAAQNPWLAMRAVAISASGILLFWAARTAGVSAAGAIAFAVVLVSITSLLQAYGVDTTLFSENRAPGGTLGNRNFVAHAAAFGFPVLLLVALRAQTTKRYILGSIGIAIVTASLVLTRSRAAWLAFAVVMVVFLGGMMVRAGAREWRRFAGIVLLVAAGVGAAIVIPNTLRWRSDNPYVETLQHVTNYQEGSGRGRLIQYEQSLLMALHHPLLGVGPGNWAVDYPEHARRNDPSMSDTIGGTTTNPWPSSDWVAILSERGPIAFTLLVLAFLGIALDALRRFRGDEGLVATALLATLAGAVVAGAFDAVLLLALPTFLVWTALGALWQSEESGAPASSWPFRRLPGGPDGRQDAGETAGRMPALLPATRMTVVLIVILSLAGLARSVAQIAAMQIYTTRGDRASLEHAAQLDPGNYRLQLRLARLGNRKQRCEHAVAAHDLYPHADAARALSRGCE
jgi:O-antigen ligase